MSLKDLPVTLDTRKGLTVAELIVLLTAVEDKTRYVAHAEPGFGLALTGVIGVSERMARGYAGSYSFQSTPIVELT
jgi:hypothetical protein